MLTYFIYCDLKDNSLLSVLYEQVLDFYIIQKFVETQKKGNKILKILKIYRLVNCTLLVTARWYIGL